MQQQCCNCYKEKTIVFVFFTRESEESFGIDATLIEAQQTKVPFWLQPPRPRNQFFDFRVCLLFVLQDTICHFWLHPWPIYPFSHIVFSYFCCFLLHRQNNFPLDSSPQQTHNDDAIQSQACLMNEFGLSSSKQAFITSFVFPRNTSQCFQNL